MPSCLVSTGAIEPSPVPSDLARVAMAALPWPLRGSASLEGRRNGVYGRVDGNTASCGFLAPPGGDRRMTPHRPRSTPALRAVALDLWYTTWYHRAVERTDYHRAKRRAWIRTLGEVGIPAATARATLDRLRTKLNRLEAEAKASTLAQQAAWVGRWLGVRVDVERLVARLDHALARARIHPTPGVAAFLASARRRGLRLGLVSNICDESPGGIRARLQAEGLLPYFEAIVLSSEVGRAKPDPELFRRCFRALHVPARSVLFVGDLPVDGQGARRAGARFVLYLGVDRESPMSYRRKRWTEPPATPRAASWSAIRKQYLGTRSLARH